LTQLTDYYRDRAAVYDAVYAKPERQADLSTLREILPPLVAGRRVLEIAAGTGYWTAPLSGSAAAITATDINASTLDVARARSYSCRVTFEVADAYALDEVPGEFDAAFVGFFWSHVLRADLPRFLTGLHRRLEPGATVIVLDNKYVHGSSTPITRTAPSGDTFQRRTLEGREYEILKNFPSRDQFPADVNWTDLEYYWLATWTVPSSNRRRSVRTERSRYTTKPVPRPTAQL
jgi:ubiquinone/menaquinone biosynthesis C-methylase UbiE